MKNKMITREGRVGIPVKVVARFLAVSNMGFENLAICSRRSGGKGSDVQWNPKTEQEINEGYQQILNNVDDKTVEAIEDREVPYWEKIIKSELKARARRSRVKGATFTIDSLARENGFTEIIP